jgi:hypothetical protein
MSRRLLKHHQEDVRAKIQSGTLIRLLSEHANGDREMSATQIQAAKILLDKSVSNAPTVLAGDTTAPLTLQVSQVDAGL